MYIYKLFPTGYTIPKREKYFGNTEHARSYGKMIKILFVCHGSILKNPRKAHKINDCAAQ